MSYNLTVYKLEARRGKTKELFFIVQFVLKTVRF